MDNRVEYDLRMKDKDLIMAYLYAEQARDVMMASKYSKEVRRAILECYRLKWYLGRYYDRRFVMRLFLLENDQERIDIEAALEFTEKYIDTVNVVREAERREAERREADKRERERNRVQSES